MLSILPAAMRANIKGLTQKMGEQKVGVVSLGEPDGQLDLEPGSVSPFGLLNDTQEKVEVFIEREIFEADKVNFHPNRMRLHWNSRKRLFIGFSGHWLEGAGY